MTIQNPLSTEIFDILTLTPANPALGANFSLAVDSNARWQVISIHFKLNVDANAANRLPSIEGFDGTNIIHRQRPLNIQTAAIDADYDCNVATGSSYEEASILAISIPLPDHFYLQAGDSIRITVLGMLAGDQLENIIIRVKQWITEN